MVEEVEYALRKMYRWPVMKVCRSDAASTLAVRPCAVHLHCRAMAAAFGNLHWKSLEKLDEA